MQNNLTLPNLTEKELLGYRQWLSELNHEAGEEGGDFNICDPEVWEYFDPKTHCGSQVYQSFRDDELLDIMISTMDKQGKSPHFERIHIIYRHYLRLRFGGLNNAKECARVRVKQVEEREKWPPDWYTRVSVEPLLKKLEKKGKSVSDEDLDLLERLCREARETMLPPHISISMRDRINKLMDYRSALELMGIPMLSNAGLKRMIRYWKEESEKCK